MVDTEDATNAPQVIAFQVESDGLLAKRLVIAVCRWLRSVGTLTLSALIALRAAAIASSLNLSFTGLAVGTSVHAHSLLSAHV